MSELQGQPAGPAVMPGKVKAIGWLHLFGGISNLCWAGFWTLYGGVGGILTFGVGLIFCCPVFILLPVACLELYSAYIHLGPGGRGQGGPRITSFAEICTITVCNTFSVIPGILTLMFQSDPEVKAWYAENQDR